MEGKYSPWIILTNTNSAKSCYSANKTIKGQLTQTQQGVHSTKINPDSSSKAKQLSSLILVTSLRFTFPPPYLHLLEQNAHFGQTDIKALHRQYWALPHTISQR